MADLVLKNALLPNGRTADISVFHGRISHIGAAESADCVIDCHDALVIPAACDMHVHMRDGAQSAKETWDLGTKSAVCGGVSFVVDQPNTVPLVDTVENYLARKSLAEISAHCRFAINGYVKEGVDFAGLAKAGAPAFGEMFAAPSTNGAALTPEVIRDCLAKIAPLQKPVTVHAEEVKEGAVHTLLEHCDARPVSGEVATIKLVKSLAAAGTKLHFCHLSSAQSFDAAAGCSFEVAPHHLFLSCDQADPSDTHFRMNPPLRPHKETAAMWARFDEIPVIASDHAPHTIDEKSAEFSAAPSGVPGVETMLPLLMNAVHEKKISLAAVIEKTAVNPYKILGFEAPVLQTGGLADFAVYEKAPQKITAENLHSKAGWTPYEGMAGVFPSVTVIAGSPVWYRNEISQNK
ncbi:MAG TPA: dihydroorotase [Methanocorpusculum sp.]|nr:dihydroorotase [Methanocorpusculum sp.]